MDLQQYWEVIQRKICPRCLDGDGGGACRLPVDEECALKSLLPEIVATVTNVQAASLESYVTTLRQNVCSLCKHQASDSSCRKRHELECALDRYYPLVVEIIETVQSTLRNANSVTGFNEGIRP
jgi:hypothetical protein